MTKPKGGQGKKAPYQTKLMRVPVPMKTQVGQLVDRYQSYLASGGDALNPPMLLGDSESLHGSKPKGGRGKKAPILTHATSLWKQFIFLYFRLAKSEI